MEPTTNPQGERYRSSTSSPLLPALLPLVGEDAGDARRHDTGHEGGHDTVARPALYIVRDVTPAGVSVPLVPPALLRLPQRRALVLIALIALPVVIGVCYELLLRADARRVQPESWGELIVAAGAVCLLGGALALIYVLLVEPTPPPSAGRHADQPTQRRW